MAGYVAAVVLAAGSSARAGDVNKLLVSVEGAPMVAHVVEALQRSDIEQIVVITGFDREQVEATLTRSDVDCHFNSAYLSGMASSLAEGVLQVRQADAVAICLGDMPHVTTEALNRLVESFHGQPDKHIFIPVSNGVRGNPVLFTRKHFDALQALTGDTGAKRLIHQHERDVCEVPVSGDGVLKDYDTAQSLQTLSGMR